MLQANADAELVFGVNPAWRQVDRIIAERTTSANAAEVRSLYSERASVGITVLPAMSATSSNFSELEVWQTSAASAWQLPGARGAGQVAAARI